MGLCAYTLDLVVAAAPTVDLLLGVDFLDSSGATIHMKKRQALLTGMMKGALITQPVPIYVGKGPGAPIRTVLCVEHDDQSAGGQSCATPATEKITEKATEKIKEETAEKAMDITPAEPKAASLVARLRELADQLDSSHQSRKCSANGTEPKCCTIGTHKINTGEAPPVRQRAYRYSRPDNEFIGDTIRPCQTRDD